MDAFVTITSLLSVLVLFLLTAAYVDYRKRKFPTKYPFVSFIIPAYNSGDFIDKCIRALYDSYDRKKFELIFVNDGSRDNTLKVLNELKKEYKFRIINNKVNMGKTASINMAVNYAKSDLIGFIDSDITVSKKILDDMVARLENDEKIGAVGASRIARDRGFFEALQSLEYNMATLPYCSFNLSSCIGLSGYCMIVKKDLFEKCGKFAIGAIGEDVDLALKINALGFRVEHSYFQTYTTTPDNLYQWIRQKIRWGAGAGQAMMGHLKTALKNPVIWFFIIFYALFASLLSYSMFKSHLFIPDIITYLSNPHGDTFAFTQTRQYLSVAKHAGDLYGSAILSIIYSVFSLPYAVMSIKKPIHLFKVLLIFPFAIIYVPIFMFFSAIGFISGMLKYRRIKGKERAW